MSLLHDATIAPSKLELAQLQVEVGVETLLAVDEAGTVVPAVVLAWGSGRWPGQDTPLLLAYLTSR